MSSKDDAQVPLASLQTETGKQEVEQGASTEVPTQENSRDIESKQGNSQNDVEAAAEKIHTEMEKEPSPIAKKDSFDALEEEMANIPEEQEHGKASGGNTHQEEEMDAKDVDMEAGSITTETEAFPPITEAAGDKVPKEPVAPTELAPLPPPGTPPQELEAPPNAPTEPAAAEEENTEVLFHFFPTTEPQQEQEEEEKATAATDTSREEKEAPPNATEPAAAEEENTALPQQEETAATDKSHEEKEAPPNATEPAAAEEEEKAPATEPAAATDMSCKEKEAPPNAAEQKQEKDEEKAAPPSSTEPAAAADHVTAAAQKEPKEEKLATSKVKYEQDIWYRSMVGVGQFQSNAALALAIRSYAESVATSGFYLDVIDAQLLAEHLERRLFIVVDRDADQLEFQIVDDYLATMLPPGMHFADLDPAAGDEPAGSDWCLLSCNALYDPVGVHNHWIPLLRKKSLPESIWIDLTAGAQSKFTLQLAEAECSELSLIARIGAIEEGSEESQALESELNSIHDYVEMLLE
eukprot:s210_g13.t1